MKNCCYECQKRHVGCHSACEDYQKFKAEQEAINQEKARRRQTCDDLNAMTTDSIIKSKNGGCSLRKLRGKKYG